MVVGFGYTVVSYTEVGRGRGYLYNKSKDIKSNKTANGKAIVSLKHTRLFLIS